MPAMSLPDHLDVARPEGFQRVRAALAQRAHPHPPCWLEVSARSAQEAADALGVALGQIAKSVVFRRKADDAAVLVIASAISELRRNADDIALTIMSMMPICADG